jgi:hypothetical protein
MFSRKKTGFLFVTTEDVESFPSNDTFPKHISSNYFSLEYILSLRSLNDISIIETNSTETPILKNESSNIVRYSIKNRSGYDETYNDTIVEKPVDPILFKKKELFDLLNQTKYSIKEKISIIKTYNSKYGLEINTEFSNKVKPFNINAEGILDEWNDLFQS